LKFLGVNNNFHLKPLKQAMRQKIWHQKKKKIEKLLLLLLPVNWLQGISNINFSLMKTFSQLIASNLGAVYKTLMWSFYNKLNILQLRIFLKSFYPLVTIFA
jgi:hypothetical protein